MALSFRQLTPHFAAEVGPVDLRQVHDAATLAKIRGGMDRYAVLVFHDQPFTDPEHLDFAQRLDGVLHTKLGINGGGANLSDIQMWKSLYLGYGQWGFSTDGRKASRIYMRRRNPGSTQRWRSGIALEVTQHESPD